VNYVIVDGAETEAVARLETLPVFGTPHLVNLVAYALYLSAEN